MVKLLFLFLSLFLFSVGAFALDCDIYIRSPDEMAAYQAINKRLADKYPVLKSVMKDPEEFILSTQAKFEAQKLITPDNPYAFDYTELGMPALDSMNKEITEKVAGFNARVTELQSKTGVWAYLTAPFRAKKIKEYQIAMQYLDDVQKEIQSYLYAGKVDYKNLYEISYFYSRAIGHFDLKMLNMRDRLLLYIDRYLQGYKQLKIEEEYALFQQRSFSVFQKESPVEGFKQSAQSFENAFLNQDKLEMIILPTTEELGPDIFSRLVSYDVFPISMTSKPVAADGFVRPGGDFWMHDIRHSSAIFATRKDYNAMFNLSINQVTELRAKTEIWKTELDAARKQIEDKELRYAIGFFMFNFHHDRGYPMLPSSYVDDHLDHVPYLLYYTLKVSKQPLGFKNPYATMNKAYAWLQDFWLQRLETEKAILKRSMP